MAERARELYMRRTSFWTARLKEAVAARAHFGGWRALARALHY